MNKMPKIRRIAWQLKDVHYAVGVKLHLNTICSYPNHDPRVPASYTLIFVITLYGISGFKPQQLSTQPTTIQPARFLVLPLLVLDLLSPSHNITLAGTLSNYCRRVKAFCWVHPSLAASTAVGTTCDPLATQLKVEAMGAYALCRCADMVLR
jgi:hypothetical protein